MTITLENITAYIGIILFCGAFMNYVVIAPLNKSIIELRMTIKSIDEECRIRTERLVQVEASAKQAHKRIDGIEQRLNNENK